MGYLSIRQTAEKWNLSARWISDLCKAGRIPGATKIGSYWAIPADAEKPADARIKSGRYVKKKKTKKGVVPMAAINDLISQIQDETLRNRIQEEVSKMAKQKKFGLVFEEHMPESTPLYDMPIKRGCNVMLRDSKDDKAIYVVLKVEGDTAVCVKPEQKDEAVTFELKDIVRVAEFGESIYPYLKPLDSVCNAPDSNLWHTLIEADNYHALQLLEYLYAGKVDCIYIDPPYNTGAKDWKYNNDYVDGNDAYRHSKWLSFMERRLKLAKKLLNPADSVLIVTIDEKEYLHLGCLLEEMFPEAEIQMISSVINPKGSARTGRIFKS